MTNNLSAVLAKIGEAHQENIWDDSRYYREISIWVIDQLADIRADSE